MPVIASMEPNDKKAAAAAQITITENGAGDEIRTHDFDLGKVALYP